MEDDKSQPKALTDARYWHDTWVGDTQQIPRPSAFFEKQLRKFLPADPRLTFLEIGCYPGQFMVLAHKAFGYKVSGLDYVDSMPLMGPMLEAEGVTDFELFHEDFFKFRTDRMWDIVTSIGFVEHFEETASIVARHAELTSPGGYVVIVVPNFRYGQRLLQRIFAPDVPRTHNVRVDKNRLALDAAAAGMEVIYSGFLGTTFLFYSLPRKGIPFFILRAVRKFERLLEILNLDNLSNRWLSPYSMVIGRKPA